jgi:16S rRNA (uracil1498-N3)-methyltransferase
MIPHLYVDSSFNFKDSAPLTPPQHHYLTKVLRLKTGDAVNIFNGIQGLWQSHLNDHVLDCLSPLQPQPEQPPRRALFFSPIKQQNWLIEKATELGVTDFFPILCQRTVVRHFCAKRHLKIIHEACEQSRRLHIPQLHPLKPVATYFLEHATEFAGFSGPLVSLDLTAPSAMTRLTPCHGVFIGPEGGWSPKESAQFKQTSHIAPLHLGAYVLRAETAALVASTWMCMIVTPQEMQS